MSVECFRQPKIIVHRAAVRIRTSMDHPVAGTTLQTLEYVNEGSLANVRSVTVLPDLVQGRKGELIYGRCKYMNGGNSRYCDIEIYAGTLVLESANHDQQASYLSMDTRWTVLHELGHAEIVSQHNIGARLGENLSRPDLETEADRLGVMIACLVI